MKGGMVNPRRYRMGARAEAVAATRAGIVETAKDLHAERGVLATSWDDIAGRAGVATATVYRHFPSVDELVEACARSVFDLIQPPTPDEAAVIFSGVEEPADRLEQLVRDSIHCYSLGEGWLHAAHRERDFVPALDRALQVIQGSLSVLVRVAAGPGLHRRDHAALVVLCDFPFWRSLLDAGLSRRAAQATVIRLVRSEVERIISGQPISAGGDAAGSYEGGP